MATFKKSGPGAVAEIAEQISREESPALWARIDALTAELEALRGQEPVAWMHPAGGVLQRLSSGLERDVYTIPLFLAAGAQGANGWGHLRQYGYAPGNYMGLCGKCGKVCYDMDKRAITCRSCAEAMHASRGAPEGWQPVPKSIHPLNNNNCGGVMDLLRNPPSAEPFDDECDYYDHWWSELLAAAPKLEK